MKSITREDLDGADIHISFMEVDVCEARVYLRTISKVKIFMGKNPAAVLQKIVTEIAALPHS